MGPKWTVSSLKTIVGEDHLGIRSVAIAIAERLQSGITSITPRARYYAFFAWVLHDFIQTQSDKSMSNFRNFLKRQEWYYILANLADADHLSYTPSGVIGITKGLEVWKQGLNEFPLFTNYLKHPLGGYNVYRNVMKILGITVEGDASRGIEIDRLTASGLELAEAFEETIKDTAYFSNWRHAENKNVPASVLVEYGHAGGLSNLNLPDAKDQLPLKRLFFPDNSTHDWKQLRRSSLAYYQYIVKQMNGRPLHQVARRRSMYDYIYGGSHSTKWNQIPEPYHAVALGWEIFHGRQLFTYSLESIWCFVLDVMSRRPYRISQLILSILSMLEQQGINLETSVKTWVLQMSPLDLDDRDKYVVTMTSKEGSIVDRVWNPLLVMVDVVSHFRDKSRFEKLHHDFYKMGERDHISLSTFEFDLSRYMDKPISEYLEFLIRYYILEQHQNVALNKILGTGNDTYHFVDNDGKLDFLHDDSPVFNAFRVDQAMSVLKDLGFLREHQGIWTLTQREVQFG